MIKDFRKKTSGIFITVFIGLIIVSFVISGYNGDKSGTSTIGTVGDYKIDFSDFQSVYERQLDLYKQIYGGKDLSAKEVAQFQIRENIVKQLVQQRLVLVFADRIGIIPSPGEIRDTITNFSQGDHKLFQTNGVFNLELYKKLLTANRITPTQFEKQSETSLKNKQVIDLISKVPISKSFQKELEDIRRKTLKTDFIVINKKQMEKFVNISEKEISDYLAKNINQVKAQFEIAKNQLSKPEEIKLRQIFISKDHKDQEKIINEVEKNLKPNNFIKMANQYNDSPEQPKNGGDLGWVSKGRSIPEFDSAFDQIAGTISKKIISQYGTHFLLVEEKKPKYIPQFEDLKQSITKEILQSTKPFEVEKMVQSISKEIGEYLKANKIAAAEDLAKKYNLNFQKDTLINPLDATSNKVSIPFESLIKIFNEKLEKPQTFIFANPMGVSIVRAAWDNSAKAESDTNTIQSISSELANVLANDITNLMKNEVKVSIYKFYE